MQYMRILFLNKLSEYWKYIGLPTRQVTTDSLYAYNKSMHKHFSSI